MFTRYCHPVLQFYVTAAANTTWSHELGRSGKRTVLKNFRKCVRPLLSFSHNSYVRSTGTASSPTDGTLFVQACSMNNVHTQCALYHARFFGNFHMIVLSCMHIKQNAIACCMQSGMHLQVHHKQQSASSNLPIH